MNRFTVACIKLLLRVLMPGFAASLREEGQFDFSGKPVGTTDPSSYIDVEDNGSEITVVAFAGMAVLYAAMPKFEFRKVLGEGGGRYNLVFVRDIHRSLYALTPEGRPGGTEFYACAVKEAVEGLGSRYNVAMGASGGGEVAFRMSGGAPIHHIVAFNPAFPLDNYASPGDLRKVLLDFGKLFRKPGAYLEMILVMLGARYLWKRNCRMLGQDHLPDALQNYLRRSPPASATIFYSEGSWPDAQQAARLSRMPSITVKAVDSPRHNCMADLKKQGRLGRLIHEEIQAAFTEWKTARRD